jgi:hypothetical protein
MLFQPGPECEICFLFPQRSREGHAGKAQGTRAGEGGIMANVARGGEAKG